MTTRELQEARPNGQAAAVPEALALEFERIEAALAALDFDPHNLNKHSAEAIDALAASIATVGLLNEPIVAHGPQAGRYRVIAGEGRVRAMLQLGWTVTPVRCLRGQFAEQQLADLGLTDNVLKEDIDLLALGLYCNDDMNRTGRSARELAKVLGNKKDASTITRAVALVKKLPEDLREAVRGRRLPPSVARVLTGLKDDEAKRRFAQLYLDRKVKSGPELAAAIRADRNGTGPAAAASFTFQQDGARISVTLPGQDPAAAEPALRQLLKALRDHGGAGLEGFKDYLEKRGIALRKAAELQAAKDALAAT